MYSRYMRGSFWEEPDEKKAEEKKVQPKEQRKETADPRREAPKPVGGGLSALLKGFDTGDLLLAAIVLFLLLESDDLEMVIALAMVLLGGV